MANYKRKRRRGAALCGLCKPHKKPGCRKPRQKAIAALTSLLISLLAGVSAASAQVFGLDTLAGAKYPREVRTIPNHYAVGFFAETFGDAFSVVRQELAAGRIHVRVHLMWSDQHQFGDRDIRTITRLARKYQPLCAQYPGRLELSPFCEHNLGNPDKYLDIVARESGCTVVNTPWKGAISRKYKNEVHGDHAKPQGRYNFSFDGTNSVDADMEAFKRRHAGAEVLYLWNPRLNLKWSMKDTTPRPQRKAIPSPEFLDSLEYLTTAKGQTSLPKRWLAKSHADRHQAVDPKGDKLLIISPIRGNAVELRKAGKVVATLRYYGAFDGGGFRYYATTMGFKLGPNLGVFMNGKQYGTINGGFRDATFRP